MKNIKYSILNLKWKPRSGVTLIELMITVLIATLVVAGIGVAMVDSIKSFPKMYDRTEGSVINESYVTRAAFDRVCRKASVKLAEIDSGGTYIEVYYYNDANSISMDRYTRFYRDAAKLKAEHGTCSISGLTVTKTGVWSTETLATFLDTTKPPKFAVHGSSVTMALSLINGTQEMTVTSTAVRHN